MSIIITGGSRTRTVGEPVELTVGVTAGAGVISDVKWKIEGKIVKNYEGPELSFRLGKVHPVTAADKQAPTIKFYWYTKGTFSVTAKYKLDGKAKQDKATFKVKRPRLVSFTSKTGSARRSVVLDGGRMGFIGPLSWSSARRGITWKGKVSRSGASTGELAFIQLLDFSMTFTPGVTLTSAGDWVLDGAAGKTRIFYWQFTEPLTGRSATITANDQPSTPLTYRSPGALSVDDKNRFKLYLMYKSSAADSIWVPLGLLRWRYRGKALRAGLAAPWFLRVRSIAVNPVGRDWQKFPEWTQYVPDLL